MENPRALLNFLHLAENLKIELRNGRTSTGKQESVAEHTWRLCLMVLLFGKSLDKPISMEKALKIAIIHDLAEIVTGDTPYYIHENSAQLKNSKHDAEARAMEKIRELLPQEIGSEIFELWEEYEKNETLEAQFIKAIDKIEAQIQQNEMDFSFWNKYHLSDAFTRLDKYCEFDSFLKQIKKLVQEESHLKIETHTKKNRKNSNIKYASC